MAKRINVKFFDKSEEKGARWKKEAEFDFAPYKELKYGENPQQKAEFYKSPEMIDYEVIDKKELSYNEIMNVIIATNIVSEFFDVSAVAIVKHSSPCAVALGVNIEDAYNKAFDCDPISSFFGTIEFSQTVDYEVAKHINSMSVKVVAAPDYDKKALKLLQENMLIKLIKINTPLKEYRNYTHRDIKITPFGTLVQDFNKSQLSKQSFKIVTQTKPTQEQIEDAVFAWKISKYARTNSVVIAKDFKTTAISQGLINPVTAVEYALDTACDGSKNAVLVSDNALPTTDCIHAAAQGRISMIIQPGGSAKDTEIISLADKYNIAMIMTGIKNYRH